MPRFRSFVAAAIILSLPLYAQQPETNASSNGKGHLKDSPRPDNTIPPPPPKPVQQDPTSGSGHGNSAQSTSAQQPQSTGVPRLDIGVLDVTGGTPSQPDVVAKLGPGGGTPEFRVTDDANVSLMRVQSNGVTRFIEDQNDGTLLLLDNPNAGTISHTGFRLYQGTTPKAFTVSGRALPATLPERIQHSSGIT